MNISSFEGFCPSLTKVLRFIELYQIFSELILTFINYTILQFTSHCGKTAQSAALAAFR